MANQPKSPLHGITIQLEQLSVLDRPAEFIAGLYGAIPEGARGILRGDQLGHSLHPLLTDLPIGFWTSSVILDLIGGKSSHRAADTLLAGGVLTFLPAAITGGTDLSEKAAPGPMRRVGLLHAALNVGALSIFTASLKSRVQGRRGRGRMLSLVGAGVLSAAGYLGGHMSYAGGVGVGEPEPTQPPHPVNGSPPVAPPPAATAS